MRTSHSQFAARRSRRRGFFSLELALTLPILGAVLFAVFEFSLLLSARGALLEASRVGARKASLPGVTPADVEAEIRTLLSPRWQQGLQVAVDPGLQTGDVVAVAVQLPMSAAAPDLLWPVGISLRGRQLYAETRMLKE